MDQLSRRTFFKHAGAAAAVAGAAAAGSSAVSLLQAAPADASGIPQIEGLILDQGGEVYNIKSTEFGAMGNVYSPSSTGSITAGSTSFTWSGGASDPTGGFQYPGDVGKVITIQGAGATSALALAAKIVTVHSPTEVILNTAAGTGTTSAAFAYGTDDTTAIQHAITSANGVGRIFAPPGVYMITESIELSGTGGMVGCGAKSSGGGFSSTVFLCGASASGILANGAALYQGFLCDGNNIASTPMQNGTVVAGDATTASSNSTFIDIWVPRSTAAGWTILGAQNNTYRDCRAIENATDGVYIDGGASGLEFWDWQCGSNLQYSIHGDKIVPGGTGTTGNQTEHVRFYGGICDTDGLGVTPKEKIHLTGAVNWAFPTMNVVGKSVNGPTVVLDQGTCYGIDFTGAVILGASNNGNPGYACIQVNNEPPLDCNPYTFLITDDVWFFSGDTSVYMVSPSNPSSPNNRYRYSGQGWFYDATANGTSGGPYAGQGFGPDALLAGRTGKWQSITAGSPWYGTVGYRVDADGLVRLKGSVMCESLGGSSAAIFTLIPGYRPSTAVQIAAATNGNNTGYITVSTGGVVAPSNLSYLSTIYLDGISFSVT